MIGAPTPLGKDWAQGLKPYIHFILKTKPVGQMRHRDRVIITKTGRAFAHSYKAAKQRTRENELRQRAEVFAPVKPLTGPIKQTVNWYFAMPKSWSQKKKNEMRGQWHTNRPDKSNCVKHLEDVFNGLFYVDDSQVCANGEEGKYWADVDAIEVTIEEL